MADERIGVLIELEGKDAAIRGIKELKSAIEQTRKDKLRLEIDEVRIKEQLREVKARLDELRRKEKIQIEADAAPLKAVREELARLAAEKKALSTQQKLLSIDAREIRDAKELLQQYNNQMREASGLKNWARLMGDKESVKQYAEAYRVAKDEYDKLKNYIEKNQIRINIEKDRLTTDIQAIDQQIQNLKRTEQELMRRGDSDALKGIREDIEKAEEEAKRLKGELDSINTSKNIDSIAIRELSNALSEAERNAVSLKEVLAGIGSGFSTAGGILNSIAGVFDSDLFSMVKKVLTYQGTRLLEEGWKNAAQRFDILSTYSDYMGVMGVSGATAQASLDKVNANIQGLPIGLDEAAFQIRKYNMYLDDAERATNLAIGLDKAMIAGGASEQMRNYAKFEIDRLLAVGTLATARQWNSLLQGLGVSTKILQKEMGYASLTTSQFVEELTDGTITTDEFLAGLESLSNSDALEEMLDIYRTTLESGLSNLKFAATRGFANLIQGIDDTLRESTGKGISDYMYQIRDEMNAVFKSVDTYIRNNPDMLTDVIDMFKNVYEHAKGVDWAGIATSTLRSFGNFLDMVVGIFEHIPPGLLRSFVTFGMVWAGPLGRALSNIGAFFRLLSRIPGLGRLPFLRLGRSGSMVGTAGLKSIGLSLLEVAGFIGIVAEAFGTMKLAVSALNDIDSLDLSADFTDNLQTVINTVGIVSTITLGLTAAFGAVGTTGVGAAAVAIGELLTAGIFADVGLLLNDIKTAVSALSEISEMDTTNLPHNIGEIVGSISGAMKVFSGETVQNTLADRIITGNIAAIAEHIGKMKKGLEDVKAIEGIKIDFEKVTPSIEGMIGMLHTIATDTFPNGLPDAWKETGDYALIFSNLDEILTHVTGFATKMGELRRDLEDPELGMWIDQETFARLNPNSPWNDTVVRMKALFKGMQDIGDEMNLAFDKVNPERNAKKAKNLNTMFADLYKAFENFGKFASPTSDVNQVTVELASKKLEGMLPHVQPVIQALENISYMTKGWKDRRGSRQSTDLSPLAEKAQAIQQAMYSLTLMMGQLAVAGSNLDAVDSGKIVERIQSTMQKVRSLFVMEIPDDAEDIKKKCEALQGAVESVADIIDTMQAHKEAIEAAENDDTATKVGGIISQLVGSFSTEEFVAIQEQISQMTEWLESLATSSSTLASIDFGPFIESIEDVSKKVDEVKAKVELLSDAFVTLSDSADHAKSAIDRVADTAVARQGDFSGLEGAIRRVREVLSGAAAQADALTQAIDNIPKYTDIVVNVHMGGAVGAVGTGISAGINAIRSRYQADGGVIYAANGFQKRGTDVVPAMLTPGEFVVRKAAVDTFGSRLMRQINSLNIEGAMREMFSYTGLPIGVNSVVDNSRSYDSHNSVTQNVYSNNPNYSKKRAYKGLCMA